MRDRPIRYHIIEDDDTMCGNSAVSSWRRAFDITDYHRAVFVCFVTFLSTAYTSVYPFTYLPDMIRWFGYKESEKGFYAGFIASAYFAGSGLFSYFWGWLSDRKGRKPVLVFQLVSTGVFCLLYGFCWEFYTAMAIRFIDGAVNGVTVVVNAILYDHSNNDNQAFAVSVVATSWGIGVCVGPLIAGYLATPAIKYPWAFSPDHLFGRFPYLIPSFAGFALAMISALAVFVILPPARSRVVNNRELLPGVDAEMTEINHAQSDEIPAIRRNGSYIRGSSDDDVITRIDNMNDDENVNSNTSPRHPFQRDAETAVTTDEIYPICKDKPPKTYGLLEIIERAKATDIFTICQYPGIMLVLMAFSLYSFATIGNWEILPVWLSTDLSLGGLGFNSDSIGLVMGTVTMFGLVLQSFLVVQLEKRVGGISAYIAFGVLLVVAMQVTALCRLLRETWSLWTAIYVNSIALSTALPACNGLLTLITNNCSPPEHVGAVNGLTQTLGSFFRAFAPVVGGNIFTASITSSVGPPIDPSTVFAFFAFVVWLSVVAVYFLPRNLNSQNKRSRDADPNDPDPEYHAQSDHPDGE